MNRRNFSKLVSALAPASLYTLASGAVKEQPPSAGLGSTALMSKARPLGIPDPDYRRIPMGYQEKRIALEALDPGKLFWPKAQPFVGEQHERQVMGRVSLLSPRDIVNELQRLILNRLSERNFPLVIDDDLAIPGNRIGYVYCLRDCRQVSIDTLAHDSLAIYDQDLTMPLERFSHVFLDLCATKIAHMIASSQPDLAVVGRLELPGGMEWSYNPTNTQEGVCLPVRLVRGYDVRENVKLTSVDVLFGTFNLVPRSSERNGDLLTINDEYGRRTIPV